MNNRKKARHTKNMKKITTIFISLLFVVLLGNIPQNYAIANETKKPMLAIVIDDFGQDRNGVEKMLTIDAPITCAIMPDLEHTKEDAERAHKKGYEIILHMPLESKNGLPRSWYGPKIIHNSDNIDQAKKTFIECFESIPYAVGSNYHIGTGVSENLKLMTAIMEVSKAKNIYFLDSKTTMKSACKTAAEKVGTSFLERDLFLENAGPNYNYTKNILNQAVQLSKNKGYAIVIGHVGPMGGDATANAIIDSIKYIQEEGIEIVPLSAIAKAKKYSYPQK